jgi:hypothetical protein
LLSGAVRRCYLVPPAALSGITIRCSHLLDSTG